MKRFLRLSMCGLLLAGATNFINAENVVMSTPGGFSLLAVSPNGKWACGIQPDAYNPQVYYGFRWNLESGTIEMLGEDPCLAFDVANDGTVSGEFEDKTYYPNELPLVLPGFWRDGEWHSVEIPAGATLTEEGIGYNISPDGHYMTGSLPIDGQYIAFIWKDGAIHRQLPTEPGKGAVGCAVSPDGNAATGFIQIANRVACYWAPDGSIRYFEECEGYSQSPWHYGRRFSPDGTKLLYWGGLQPDYDLNTAMLYCIYDIANDQVKKVACPSMSSDMEFFSITDNETMVGYESGRGFIYKDGVGQYVDEYLAAKGVDYGDFANNFYDGLDYLPFTRLMAISADEKVYGIQYYTAEGEEAGLIVKLDQDLSALPPVEVKVQQLPGIYTAKLDWTRPYGAQLRGYNVYRDGTKISGFMPINRTSYFDKNLQPGTYEYKISAVNMSGQETFCEPMQITLADHTADVLPYNIAIRQKGVNKALIEWEAPLSRGIHLNYASPADPKLTSLNIYDPVDVEMAVRYDKAYLDNYAGSKITEVSFRPLSSNPTWQVNLYSVDPDTEELTLIHSVDIAETLPADKTYTVEFDTPVELPATDLIIAVRTEVVQEGTLLIAAGQGNGVAGYSDLLRSEEEFEDEFFSVNDKAAASGTYYNLSWAIDMGLTGLDGNVSGLTTQGFNLYMDDEDAISAEECDYQAEGLSEGLHTFAVEAVYSNGSISPKASKTFTITENYPSITDVEVEKEETEPYTGIVATWATPTDEDRTVVSYTDAQVNSGGVQGPSASEYEYMAASLYPASKFKGYEGYAVKSLRFYPLTDATYTVMLVEGGTDIVAGEQLTEYTKNAWNEVKLTTPYVMKDGTDYMIAVYVGEPTPGEHALGTDNYPCVSYYSDLYSLTGGNSWNSLYADAGINGNWMMGIVIMDPSGEELAVDGYDVVIDNVKRNDEKVTENKFEYTFPNYSTKRHFLHVDTYYAGRDEAVKGQTNYFYLETSGVSNTTIETLQLLRGDNYLVARGEGVEQISLYNMKGINVAAAKGDRVEISALESGVYVVEITVNGKKQTRKITIVK